MNTKGKANLATRIGQISFVFICVLLGGYGVAHSDNGCIASHVQLEHRLSVTKTFLQMLRRHAVIDCASGQPTRHLVTHLADFLAKENIAIEAVEYQQNENQLLTISIATSADDLKSEKRSIVLPLRQASQAFDEALSIIRMLPHITGEALEGNLLRGRFVIDVMALDTIGGEVDYIWLRDGEAVASSSNSRYVLGEDDVGKRLKLRVEIRDSSGGLVERIDSNATAPIVMAEHAPSIRGLAIIGEAHPGEELLARYDFYDRNPDDSEEGSLILWLRDNEVIAEAEGSRYRLSEDDIGKRITVMVTPRSSDGMKGETERTTTGKKVEPKLITLPQAQQNASAEVVISEPPPPRPKIIKKDPITYLAEKLGYRHDQSASLAAIDFSESDLLATQDLKSIEANYKGQPLSLEVIRSILNEVSALYEEAGYALSRPLLPQQIIENGRLNIQLVEAKIGVIVFENRKRVSEKFILARLGIDSGDYISLETLEHNIRRFNANNKTCLTTELAAGENFGETDIFVNVKEAELVELPSVSVNNHGSELSDWQQNTFTTVFNNLLARDDELSLSYSSASGSDTKAIGFSLPIGTKGFNLNLSHSDANTKIKSGPAQTVGFRGKSNSSSIGASMPIIFNDRYSLYLSAAYARSYGDLVQPNTELLLAKNHTRKFSISTPMSWSNGLTTLSFVPSYSVINSITEVPKDERWMSKLEGEIALAHLINPLVTLNLRNKFLYSNSRYLVNLPSEILSVGGPQSVRAYQPSEDSGYKGYFLSAELRSDVATWGRGKMPSYLPHVQPYIFVDHMFAQSRYKISSRKDYWSGAGIGLTIPLLADWFTFDAYWAEPLDGDVHAVEKKAYDDDLFQFSLTARVRWN